MFSYNSGKLRNLSCKDTWSFGQVGGGGVVINNHLEVEIGLICANVQVFFPTGGHSIRNQN